MHRMHWETAAWGSHRGVSALSRTGEELSQGAAAAALPPATGWALLTSRTDRAEDSGQHASFMFNKPAMYLDSLLCVCFHCNVLLFMMSWQKKFKWIVTIIYYHLFSEILANACFLHRLFITKQIRNLLFPCRQRLSGWKTSLASNWRSRQKREDHFNSLL